MMYAVPAALDCADRYLLFKSSREELVEDIEALKKKIRCVLFMHQPVVWGSWSRQQ